MGQSKQSFSEYGHVAYQIKGNDRYSNMQANILPLHVPLVPGVGKNRVWPCCISNWTTL